MPSGGGDHGVDPLFQLHEGAVSGHVAHGSLDLFADRVTVLDLVPRIGLELADAEADLLLVAVDAEDDCLQLLADGEDIARARNALGPRELGDVDEALDR
jgi:hypothetical protein